MEHFGGNGNNTEIAIMNILEMERVLNVPIKHATSLRKISVCNSPFEACSLLFGLIKNCVALVKEVHHMQNIDLSRNSFQISGDELLCAYEHAQSENLNVIGIFHSHFFGTKPSDKDLTYMEINPVIWLIYSVSECQFGAYVMENTLQEVVVEIIKE